MKLNFLAGMLWIAGSVAMLSGCGSSQTAKQSGETESKHSTSANPLPSSFFLKEPPAGAKNIVEMKKSAKEGDEVVMRGKVGGRKTDTFTSGRATMFIVDLALDSCNLRPGDDCKTPWDYCCEDPADIAKNMAAVQFVDANGKVLKSDLKGLNGIDHLSVVVVKGKVARRDSDALVVSATGIYVEKPAEKKAN